MQREVSAGKEGRLRTTLRRAHRRGRRSETPLGWECAATAGQGASPGSASTPGLAGEALGARSRRAQIELTPRGVPLSARGAEAAGDTGAAKRAWRIAAAGQPDPRRAASGGGRRPTCGSPQGPDRQGSGRRSKTPVTAPRQRKSERPHRRRRGPASMPACFGVAERSVTTSMRALGRPWGEQASSTSI